MDPTMRTAGLVGDVDELQRVCGRLCALLSRVPGDIREQLAERLGRGLKHVAVQLETLQRVLMDERR